jgi:hypothetical protein
MRLQLSLPVQMPLQEAPSSFRRQVFPSLYRSLACTAKRLIHRIAYRLTDLDLLWGLISKTFVRGSQYLCSVRNEVDADRIVDRHPALREALADRQVLAGPFEGLDYRGTKAFCSSFYPKLLGTYEHELEESIRKALDKPFGLIVDVGAADGYYAVGFAFKKPHSRVIAFEQDPRAWAELANLALINGVSDRFTIKGRCDVADLLALPYDGGLMIMDCEGFEEHLLSPEVISHLRHWDFFVETHDGFIADMTKRLSARFADTHSVHTVGAIHDYNKADTLNHPLLVGLPRRQQDILLAEGRQHACLRWMVCRSIA